MLIDKQSYNLVSFFVVGFFWLVCFLGFFWPFLFIFVFMIGFFFSLVVQLERKKGQCSLNQKGLNTHFEIQEDHSLYLNSHLAADSVTLFKTHH